MASSNRRAGAVSIAGAGRLDDPAALHKARCITANIFQDHALIGRLPAIENVLLGLADMRHPHVVVSVAVQFARTRGRGSG